MMDDENSALRAINPGFRALDVTLSNTPLPRDAPMALWTRSGKSIRSIHELMLIKADTERLMGGLLAQGPFVLAPLDPRRLKAQRYGWRLADH
jgi:hypothetical protein